MEVHMERLQMNIHMALRQIQLLFLRLSGIAAVGMSGGKFVIIQNPQPHLSLLCFGTDVVQERCRPGEKLYRFGWKFVGNPCCAEA